MTGKVFLSFHHPFFVVLQAEIFYFLFYMSFTLNYICVSCRKALCVPGGRQVGTLGKAWQLETVSAQLVSSHSLYIFFHADSLGSFQSMASKTWKLQEDVFCQFILVMLGWQLTWYLWYTLCVSPRVYLAVLSALWGPLNADSWICFLNEVFNSWFLTFQHLSFCTVKYNTISILHMVYIFSWWEH